MSYFLAHIEDDSVSLKHHGLSPSETTAISQALKVLYSKVLECLIEV